MTVTTRYPSSYTVISGTWASQANLAADDGAVCSITRGTTKNTQDDIRCNNFGFDALIPSGDTINSVTIEVEHMVASTANLCFLENFASISGTPGAVNSDDLEPTTLTARSYTAYARPGGGAWTRADLLDGVLTVTLRARNGNNATSNTWSWDYVRVVVDHSTPAYADMAGAGTVAVVGTGVLSIYTPPLITLVGTPTTDTSGTARTSTVLTSPAGTQADDVLVAVIGYSTGTAANGAAPDGTWTLVNYEASNTYFTQGVWYKVLTGAADATYTFTHDSTVTTGALMAFRGVDTAAVLDRTVQAADFAADATNPFDVPVITTATDQALAVSTITGEWTGSGNISAWPSGYTNAALMNTGAANVRLSVDYIEVPTAGNTGAVSYTLATAKNMVVGQFALKPSSGAFAAMHGTGAISVTGTAAAQVVVPLSAAGSVGVVGTANLQPKRALVGAGTVDVTGTGAMDVVAPLSAQGSVGIVGTGILSTAAAYADMAGAGTVALGGSASLDVVVPLSGAGAIGVQGTAVAGVLVPLSASGTVDVTGSGAMHPKRALSGVGSIEVSGAGTAQVVVPLSAANAITLSGTATAAVVVPLSASGTVPVVGVGNLSIAGSPYADMAGAGSVAVQGAASMQTVVPLSAQGTVDVQGTAAMHPKRALSAVGTVEVAGAGALAVLVPLTGSGAVAVVGAGAFSVLVPLSAVGAVGVVGSGVLASIPPPGNEPAPPSRIVRAPGTDRVLDVAGGGRALIVGDADRVIAADPLARTIRD